MHRFLRSLLNLGLAATAFGSLLAAAANLIGLAMALFFAALVFLVARVLLAGYDRLPEEDRAAFAAGRTVRRSAVVALAGGLLVSCAYWYAYWWLPVNALPEGLVQLLARHWRKLDFIPSAFSQLLPSAWRSGLHQYFGVGTYCFPGPPWWESMRYLRAAWPAYAIAIFASIWLCRLLGAMSRAMLRR